jgi:hypothetical protein
MTSNIVKNNNGNFSAGTINVGTLIANIINTVSSIMCATLTATGAVTGASLSAGSGTVSGGTVSATGTVSGGTVSATGAVTGASANFAGTVQTGDIQTSTGDIKHDNGEAILASVQDGATTLYHNNNAKIATTSSGISVTGTAASTTVACGTVSCGTVDSITGTFSRDGERIITNDSATTYVYYNNAVKIATTTAGIDVTGQIDSSTGEFCRNGERIITNDSATTYVYYNNAEKFRTLSNGIRVTGLVDCSSTIDSASGTFQRSGTNVLTYDGVSTTLYNGAVSGMAITNTLISMRSSVGASRFLVYRTTQTVNPSTGSSYYEGIKLYNPINGTYWWTIGHNTNAVPGQQFLFFASNTFNGTTKSVASIVNSRGSAVTMNFTGQHRCLIEGFNCIELMDKVGLIVSANKNKYNNMNIRPGISSITINDSLPVVGIANVDNDQTAFGVISNVEDYSDNSRQYSSGNFDSIYDKEEGDFRLFINSVGEGAVWVSDIGGNLSAGDYITTCTIPGYGKKQTSNVLHNYTVAKITMDCNFAPASVTRKTIKKKTVTKSIQEVANVVTQNITPENVWNATESRWEQIITVSNVMATEDVYDEYDLYDVNGNLLDEKHKVPRMITANVIVNDLDGCNAIQWVDELDEYGNVIYEDEYNLRYLNTDGNTITLTDYNTGTPGIDVFKAAFVGVTYHCG